MQLVLDDLEEPVPVGLPGVVGCDLETGKGGHGSARVGGGDRGQRPQVPLGVSTGPEKLVVILRLALRPLLFEQAFFGIGCRPYPTV